MKKIYFWSVRIIPAVILLQTLFFKFTGAPESIAIFTMLGVEPYGRIGSGIIELITAILLLIPSKSFYGALIGSVTMLGAIVSHILILGIEVNNDGGLLFTMGLTTFICCMLIIYDEKNNICNLENKK